MIKEAQRKLAALAVPAPLDQAFDPMIVAMKAAREASTGERLAIAWERESGGMARYDLALPSDWSADRIFRLAERVVKFLLWSAGGWRLRVAGPEWLCRRLQEEYSELGRRVFDAELMKKVYGRPMKVEVLSLAKMPQSTDAAIAAADGVKGYTQAVASVTADVTNTVVAKLLVNEAVHRTLYGTVRLYGCDVLSNNCWAAAPLIASTNVPPPGAVFDAEGKVTFTFSVGPATNRFYQGRIE